MRWGMLINLNMCVSCYACVAKCKQEHFLPKDVLWGKILISETGHGPSVGKQAYPVLCNHCENPPCVRVCPTQATFKREKDGIVMMDQHRCIGCRYCIVACPYGSRSFNWSDPRKALGNDIDPGFPTRTKGVVEKCNFCAERLARGQVPACVEACHQTAGVGALLFGDLEDPNSEVSITLGNKHSIQRKLLSYGTAGNDEYALIPALLLTVKITFEGKTEELTTLLTNVPVN